jgi:hypothetical protein
LVSTQPFFQTAAKETHNLTRKSIAKKLKNVRKWSSWVSNAARQVKGKQKRKSGARQPRKATYGLPDGRKQQPHPAKPIYMVGWEKYVLLML